LIEDGDYILQVPVVWVKDIQKNWMIYMVCTTVILISILLIYGICRRFINRKHDSLANSNLIELTAPIASRSKSSLRHIPIYMSNPSLSAVSVRMNN
jgi:hypothetical protein